MEERAKLWSVYQKACDDVAEAVRWLTEAESTYLTTHAEARKTGKLVPSAVHDEQVQEITAATNHLGVCRRHLRSIEEQHRAYFGTIIA